MGKKNKKDFKVLFVSLFNGEALGIRSLHSIIYHVGYNTRLLFFKVPHYNINNTCVDITEEEFKLFDSFVSEYNPDFTVFSVVSSVFGLYKKLYGRMKILGNYQSVIGGWQASLNPEECIKYSDIVSIGEGEESIIELIDKLYLDEPLDSVLNLWIKKNDKIINNPLRPIIEDLSKYPIPVFDDDISFYIENNNIIRGEIYKKNNRYGIIAGRGCPYSCTYCSNIYMTQKVYPGVWSKIRYRSVDHVMSELILVKKTLPNIDRINFYDEVLFPSKEWAEEFFSRYKNEIGLPFYCMFFPGLATEESIKLLKSSMLAGVWIGVQSGSERIRKNIYKRYYKNNIVIEQAKLFNKYDVSVRYDFIFDNPFEKLADSLESVKLMLELPQPYTMNLFSLKYFPQTEITNMALKAGFISTMDIDDKRLADRDNYGIELSQNNTDNNFINHLVVYINKLAAQSKLDKQEIFEIINEYQISKEILLIKAKINDLNGL